MFGPTLSQINAPAFSSDQQNYQLAKQNQTLLLRIRQLQQQSTIKDIRIQQLTQNVIKQAQRIEQLDKQLKTIQTMLSKLTHNKVNQRSINNNRINKQQLILNIDQIGQIAPQQTIKIFPNTQRNTKTQFNFATKYDRPQISLSQINTFTSQYVNKVAPCKNEQLSKYRRQRLLKSQDVKDIMKLQTFMNANYY